MLEKRFVQLIEALSVLGGAVFVASLIIGVFFRYVLHDALTWTDEVAMFCFTWVVLLGSALLIRESGHVRVELIENYLRPSLVKGLRIFIQILILVTGFYMVWTGWDFVQLTVGQTAPATRYPIWWRNLSLPVSGILIIIFSIINILHPGRLERDLSMSDADISGVTTPDIDLTKPVVKLDNNNKDIL